MSVPTMTRNSSLLVGLMAAMRKIKLTRKKATHGVNEEHGLDHEEGECFDSDDEPNNEEQQFDGEGNNGSNNEDKQSDDDDDYAREDQPVYKNDLVDQPAHCIHYNVTDWLTTDEPANDGCYVIDYSNDYNTTYHSSYNDGKARHH
jgi:hypothetical protein